MSEKFKSFINRYGLWIVIIIAIFFRLYNLPSTPPGLYPDEAMNGNNASEALSTGNFKVFYPENNGREGLFINIQALFLNFFKVHEAWVLRLVSALFGILTIPGIFLLVRYTLRKNKNGGLIAFFASFFTAVSFWHINFSRIGFRAIMAPFFMVWALYFLVKIFEWVKSANETQSLTSEQPPSTPQKPRTWILYLVSVVGGFVYGLGMHSYIAYRATPVIVLFVFALYWLLYKVPFKKLLAPFAVYVIASLIAFAPLGIYFLKNPQDFIGRTSEISIFEMPSPIGTFALNTLKTIGMFFFRGDGNWRHNYSGSPELFWFVGLMFLTGICIGCARTFKKTINHGNEDENFLWLVSVVWIAVAMLPVVMSNEGIPHALRSILMIPPVFILAGLGISKLIELVEPYVKKPVLTTLMVIVCLGLAAQTYGMYFVSWADNPNVGDAFSQRYAAIGHELRDISSVIPKYVVVNAGGVMVRGIPMPAQTVMFFTDSFTPDKQAAKNIHYIAPGQEAGIPNKNNSVIIYLEPVVRASSR